MLTAGLVTIPFPHIIIRICINERIFNEYMYNDTHAYTQMAMGFNLPQTAI